MEAELKKKEDFLRMKEDDLLLMREREDQNVSVEHALAQHLAAETEGVVEKYPDIFERIRVIDHELARNNLERVKKLYEQLKQQYEDLEAEHEDKQKLHTEILRLHADINLALMK